VGKFLKDLILAMGILPMGKQLWLYDPRQVNFWVNNQFSPTIIRGLMVLVS
jgi:hypothetical protein